LRKLIPIAVGAVLLGALSFAAVAVAVPGHFNQGQGESCTFDGTNADGDLQNEEVTCSGTISGLGNEPIEVFVVIKARAGCSNAGNEDIPGQRRFVSPGFEPDQGGSVDYTVTGAVNCHGNQEAFIQSPVDLEGYACTSGRPRFNKDGQQTNDNCDRFDTVTNVPVSD
jgi:hypothetical protein